MIVPILIPTPTNNAQSLGIITGYGLGAIAVFILWLRDRYFDYKKRKYYEIKKPKKPKYYGHAKGLYDYLELKDKK